MPSGPERRSLHLVKEQLCGDASEEPRRLFDQKNRLFISPGPESSASKGRKRWCLNLILFFGHERADCPAWPP